METPLQALFAYAKKTTSPERWLLDDDATEYYRESSGYAEEEKHTLLKLLGGEGRDTFERFLENTAEKQEYEMEMYFNRGLAMGVRLASLL